MWLGGFCADTRFTRLARLCIHGGMLSVYRPAVEGVSFMALDEFTRDRLENWEFASARVSLDGQLFNDQVGSLATDVEVETVTALADMFGDCGCFEGHLGSVVNAAVLFLLSERSDTVDRDEVMAVWRRRFEEWYGTMPLLPDSA